jgi:hypothetical protein
MLTDAQIADLTKDGTTFYSDVVLVIDAMADRIKRLDERIKQLEMREPAKLKLVSDGGS